MTEQMGNGINNDGYRQPVQPFSPIVIGRGNPQKAPVDNTQTVPAGTSDKYTLSTIAGKVTTAVSSAGTYIAAQFQHYILTPLTADAEYLFTKTIPLEIKRLAMKWKANDLNETDRARLNTFLDMNKIKNRYEFLNRIVSGDAGTVEDAARQSKYQLYVTKATIGPDGSITQNGQSIDPKFAVKAGNSALITRDGNNNIMATNVLLLLREDGRTKLERFTVYYMKQMEAEDMLNSMYVAPATTTGPRR